MVILCGKEIASRLGVSERTATRLLKSGDIAGFRVGTKLWRTTELHLESYVASRLQYERQQQVSLPPSSHRPIAAERLPFTAIGPRQETLSDLPLGSGLPITDRELPPHAALIGLPRKREPA